MKAKLSVKSWLPPVVCVVVFAAIATICAFFDLKINIALYNPGCFYGQFFAKLGELPTYLAAQVAGVILLNYKWSGKLSKYQKLFNLLSLFLIVAGWYVCIGSWVWKNFVTSDLDYAIVYKILATAAASAVTVFIVKSVPQEKMQKLLLFALFLIIVFAVSNIIVQIMKVIWARQRFRSFVYYEEATGVWNTEGFSPWYFPMAFSNRTETYEEIYKLLDDDAFKSFPSGHTVAAGASFALIILPDMFSSLKKKKWIFWTVPAVYTVLVAISRIVMGAHYLSDVLFGGTIAFVTAVITRKIFVKKVKSLCVDSDYSVKILDEDTALATFPENNN